MDEVLPEEVRALEWDDLPVEVIDCIVTRCSGPTLLRLRLVSKTLKEIVDTNKRFKHVVGEVCVSLDSKTLPTFLMECNLPFQRLSIDTGNFSQPIPLPWLMDSALLDRFIQRFSATIRELRVTRMFCGTVDNELKFYESLVNLRVLEVHCLEATEGGRPHILPVAGPVGRSMKVLKVTEEMETGDYFIDWIKRCPSLEEIALPDESGTETATIGREAYGGATLKRNHCYPYILRLGAEGHLHNLRILHFSEPIDLSMCSEQDKRFFFELLTEREGFRVGNASAKMLEEVRLTCVSPKWDWRTLDAFKRTVESLHGVHDMLQEEGFETLERLTFDPLDNVLSGEVGPLRLPGLRKLELSIDEFDEAVDQRALDRLCLPEEPRWSVEHLDLVFYNFVEGMALGYLDQSFPNLRSVSLDLDGCSREQKAEVIEVMRRKLFLEEMTLNTSFGTPEDAFFGGVEPPVLLQFPSLKKLRLNSCDRRRREMEVMTNRSLQLFGRMGLSHLNIEGAGWESVTNEGVRRLLGGTFGRTVVSVELPALKVKRDKKRKKLLDDVKEVARRNKARLT